MAAPIVTEKQARRETIRSKTTKKKPSYKNVLVDPFQVSWPVIEENVELEILDKMKSTFSACNLGRQQRVKVNVTSLNKKDRRKEIREKRQDLKKEREERQKAEGEQGRQTSQEYGSQELYSELNQKSVQKFCENHRCQPLVLGINNVVRCLEKDQLRLVAVCRDVHHSLLAMTNHLIPLCVSRGCPAVCLSRLQTQLMPVLAVSSLLALGIKKQREEDDNHTAAMDDLVSYISERSRPLEIPWLGNHASTGDSTKSDEVYKTVAETSAETLSTPKQGINCGMETGNISCKPDFSDLYIKKRVAKEFSDSTVGLANRNSSGFGGQDFIQFGNSLEGSSDEEGEVVSYTLLASAKTKEVNPNRSDERGNAGGDGSEIGSKKVSSLGKRKLSDTEASVSRKSKFAKARIRQKVPNPNKKKRKKKGTS